MEEANRTKWLGGFGKALSCSSNGDPLMREKDPKTTWERSYGFPLQLWSPNIFQLIGDMLGGLVETDLDMKERCRVRLWMKAGPPKIPREIETAIEEFFALYPCMTGILSCVRTNL